jgi:signal transduction histidine kinase
VRRVIGFLAWPRSLFGRLLLASTLATLVAILIAAVSVGHVLQRFVVRGMDERLGAQIEIIRPVVRPDGSLDMARAISLPPFDVPGSGWMWQITAPGGTMKSASQGAGITLAMNDHVRRGPGGPDRRTEKSQRGQIKGTGDMRLILRGMTLITNNGPAQIIAAGPARVAEAPLRQALWPLGISVGIVALVLFGAALLQLRLGLKPLGRLRASLADVRAGRATHVSGDAPTELQPLVTELNALIDQNAAGLASARGHVANLAHGLKTPLAELHVELAEPGRDPDGRLRAMVDRLDARVRHHLGRARAASPGGLAVTTLLAPAVEGIGAALARIHADRSVVFAAGIGAAVSVAVDAQDVDEIIGNLLDNAWRHAKASVALAAVSDGRIVTVTIDDDGPGLDASARDAALVRGKRMDEAGDGHGFGLSIAREFAELHGGGLTLAAAPQFGGLRAVLTLPSVAG